MCLDLSQLLLDPIPLPHARVAVVVCERRVSTRINNTGQDERRTEAAPHVTCTLVLRPHPGSLRAVDVGVVFVPYIIEEVDLVLAREQSRTDAVNRCITPTL